MNTAMEVEWKAKEPLAPRRSEDGYSIPLGYLRACAVALVVAHHAVLAYNTFAPPPVASLVTEPRWWQAFPVVDSQRWAGWSLLAGFNDIFFMALMFFLSGLFVWSSLQRKGTATFLTERAVRLGIPFVAVAAVIAPLAYYPTYLQGNPQPTPGGFASQWLAMGQWPAGPAWFVWVLLVFAGVAALLTRAVPQWAPGLGRFLSRFSDRPAAFFGFLVAVTAVLYVPLALLFHPIHWTTFGPFAFQTSRILHYLAYFLIGAGLGAYGFSRGLLSPGGALARRWLLWASLSIVAFLAATAIAIAASTQQPAPVGLEAIGGVAFVVSCAASSMAFLAFFLRFATRRIAWLDSMNANSYGIYLVHYAFVSWIQYALLPASLPAMAKGVIVTLGALLLSWGTVALLRRLPVLARVV